MTVKYDGSQIINIGVHVNTCKYFKGDTKMKTQLFQSYCTNLQCTKLWQCYNASTFKQLSVAYNNVGVHDKHTNSISQLFAQHREDVQNYEDSSIQEQVNDKVSNTSYHRIKYKLPYI